jgi:hypothetical protein
MTSAPAGRRSTWSRPAATTTSRTSPPTATQAPSRKRGTRIASIRYFHNRQDVELVRLNPNGNVLRRTRVTRLSNEPEADPILHGAFIGDYFQIDLNAGRVYVHYNANSRHVALVGQGVPIPQQDHYLAVQGE